MVRLPAGSWHRQPRCNVVFVRDTWYPQVDYRGYITKVPFAENPNNHMLHLDSSPLAHLQVVAILRFMFLTQTNRACPLLFILFLCLFLTV